MNIHSLTSITELLELNLISVRAFNVCKSKEVSLHTAGDIKRFVDEGGSFLGLKKCGRKSAIELLNIAKIATFEDLSPKVELPIKPNGIEDRFSALEAGLRQIFIDEYELFVNNPTKDDEIIAVFKVLFPKPSYLFDFQNHPQLLKDNANITTLNLKNQYLIRKEIQSILGELRRQITNKFGVENSHGIDYVAFADAQITQNILPFSDYYRFELSDDIHNYLDVKLEELTSKSSGIVRTFQRAYIKTTLDLVPFLDYSIEKFIRRFGKKLSCIKYYNQVLVPFRELVHKIIENPDKDKSIRLRIHYRFPFLLDDAVDIVMEFYNVHHFFPLFYILCEYLSNSNKRECQIFNMRFGVKNIEAKTLEEIASKFELSRERIRQILAKPIIAQLPMKDANDWEQYSDENILFFSPESEYYRTIVTEEKLQLSFEAFAQLYCSIFSYSYNDEFGCEYVVSLKYADIVNKACTILSKLQENNYSKDTYIPYATIFRDNRFQNATISNLIINDVAKSLEIHVVNNEFFFEQNFIDVGKEVYDFLYHKGEPVHIDNIQKYLQGKYPNYPFTLTSLKTKIRGTKSILPIGKTSMYKLSHWRNVYSGNIRDLIRDIMSDRELPIDIDELTDLVTDIFETNKKNIHSSISGCKDFIPFGGGLYGLRGKIYPPEYVEVDLSRLRASFDERFEQYKSFVEQYQHIPFASGEDEEESLKRWQSNVYKRILDVTDEQVEKLRLFIEANKHLPCNGIEYNFYRNCQDYLDYVKANYELPNRTSGTALYNWFYKHKSVANDYEDNRAQFFKELLSELRSYGFCI